MTRPRNGGWFAFWVVVVAANFTLYAEDVTSLPAFTLALAIVGAGCAVWEATSP